MIIVEKNEGQKIDYSVRLSKLTLNDEMTIDLSKCERDFDVHVDICINQFGMLTMGLSEKYIAQIDIPAREYTYKENGTDEEGKPKIEKVAVPFDMGKATLTLWNLEG